MRASKHRLINAAGLLLGGAFPGLALAGTPTPTVTVGPVGTAVGIPAMSSGVMIALGLLLAIIAIRLLGQSGMAGKAMSIVMLGGATVLAGLGVNNTTAGGFLAVATPDNCATDTVFDFSGNRNADSNNIENQCDSDLKIKEYNLFCDQQLSPGTYVFFDNGSPVGTVIPANSTLLQVGYCRQEGV